MQGHFWDTKWPSQHEWPRETKVGALKAGQTDAVQMPPGAGRSSVEAAHLHGGGGCGGFQVAGCARGRYEGVWAV